MAEAKLCSIATILNKSDCNSKRLVGGYSERNLTELTKSEKELLLSRTMLTSLDNLTTICEHHERYFSLDKQASFIGGMNIRSCYNPFNLHSNKRKGKHNYFKFSCVPYKLYFFILSLKGNFAFVISKHLSHTSTHRWLQTVYRILSTCSQFER